jgi:hypothetical protein
VGEALSIVHILVSRQPAVDRLPDEIGERELGVRAPRVGQVLRDEVAEPQTFVELPHEDQAAIGGDPRSLELDLQRRVERELKGLGLRLTH